MFDSPLVIQLAELRDEPIGSAQRARGGHQLILELPHRRAQHRPRASGPEAHAQQIHLA